MTGQPWECPRCHRIHAYWVAACDCPPPVTQSSGTTLGKDALCSYCGGALWVCRGSHAIAKVEEPR